MLKRISAAIALMAAFAAVPGFGQTSVTFQNGVTMLPGGLYEGTVDTEFRSEEATGAQGENETMTIDGNDGGNEAQGAIRFENLLISQGGLVPDGLSRQDILFAELRLWIVSNSDDEANIEYSRVVGPDTTKGDVWDDEDTWVSLGGDLFANEGGFLDCNLPTATVDLCPIRRDDVEAASVPDFVEANPGLESSDILNDLLDAGVPVADAIDQSFFRYDATDAVRDWLVDLQPNYGWAVNNDTTNGWDIVASELVTVFESAWTEAGLLPENFRPALTVVFVEGPILDLDGDGDVDESDFSTFLNRLGVEVDGPIPTGALGDFDFDRDVDLADFKFFKENYAEQNMMFPPLGSSALSAGGVPEPTSGMLATLALLMGVAGRRRRAST
jgi:hypothetical protein